MALTAQRPPNQKRGSGLPQKKDSGFSLAAGAGKCDQKSFAAPVSLPPLIPPSDTLRLLPIILPQSANPHLWSAQTTFGIMRSSLLAISILLGLTACQKHVGSPTVTASKPNTPEAVQLLRRRLVGTWYGDQPTKNGGRRQWITRRSSDGTFRVTFHSVDPVEGDYDKTEVGLWGVSDHYMIMLTQGVLRSDGTIEAIRSKSSYYWDLYEVIRLTDKEYSYLSIETGNRFITRRVPDDFTFPK